MSARAQSTALAKLDPVDGWAVYQDDQAGLVASPTLRDLRGRFDTHEKWVSNTRHQEGCNVTLRPSQGIPWEDTARPVVDLDAALAHGAQREAA